MRDALLSESLVRLVQLELQAYYGLNCSRPVFVNDNTARAAFDYVGITTFFTRRLENLSPRQVSMVREETQATVLIVPQYQQKQQRLKIVLWRINSDNTLRRIGLRFTNISDRELNSLPHSPALLNLLALLTPNTMTLGFVKTEVNGFESTRESSLWEHRETRLRSNLPRIISSIGFNKIDHPKAFNIFDWSGSLFPSTYLFAIDQESTFVRKDQAPDLNADIRKATVEIYGSCTNLIAMGSFYSILGTTYLAIGYGPCLHWRKEDRGHADWTIDFANRIIFGHRIFVTQDWYVFFEGDQLNFSKFLYKSDLVKSRSIGRANLGIGWYLPDVETRYTKAFFD